MSKHNDWQMLVIRLDKQTHSIFKSYCAKNHTTMQRFIDSTVKEIISTEMVEDKEEEKGYDGPDTAEEAEGIR